MELENLIRDMDIPEMRRDVSKAENLRWILRNLAVRNGDHPNLAAAMAEARRLLRGD